MNSSVRSLYDQRNVDICIEMHHTMWTDEFQNFECRDLCAGGKLFENPDLIKTSEKIKERIKNGNYLITPCEPNYLLQRNSCLTGYICVGDTPNGMRIHHTWNDIGK